MAATISKKAREILEGVSNAQTHAYNFKGLDPRSKPGKTNNMNCIIQPHLFKSNCPQSRRLKRRAKQGSEAELGGALTVRTDFTRTTELVLHNRDKPWRRHTERQTGRNTDRQTDRHAVRQTNNQTDRPTDKQFDRQMQADRQIGRQKDRQADRQTDRHADRQTDRQTDMLLE
ncbi:unnamed protein product [Arctogadus glacialis]